MLARWIMSLQALPFEGEFIPGTENDAADYLSRYPAGDQDLQGDTEDLHLSSDDVGLPALEEFQTEQNLRLQQSPACLDGYSAYPDDKVLRLRRHEGTDPIWVPATLVPAVLRYYHGPGVSGHYGLKRMESRILRRFWWKSHTKDIQNYLKNCDYCEIAKLPQHPLHPNAEMGINSTPARFHTIAVDVLSLTQEKTARGNLKILAMQDLKTRWSVAVPIPDETSTTLARAIFTHWISIFGAPVKIMSDRGPSFVDGALKRMCTHLGIKRILTSAYHPQSNGQVERLNGTIITQLKPLVEADVNEWDIRLPEVMMAYNISRHSVTGFSPYLAVFGVVPRDLDEAEGLTARTEADHQAELSTQALKKRLSELNMVISVRDRQAKLLSKKWYDKKVKAANLTPGQTVMVFDERVGNRQRDKLSNPWRGPYLLTKFKTARKAILRDPTLGNELECHVNRLRLLRDKDVPRYEVQEGMARTIYPDGRQQITSILGRSQDADGEWTYALREHNQADVTYMEESDLPPMLKDLAVESWAEFQRQHEVSAPTIEATTPSPSVPPPIPTVSKSTSRGENHMLSTSQYTPRTDLPDPAYTTGQAIPESDLAIRPRPSSDLPDLAYTTDPAIRESDPAIRPRPYAIRTHYAPSAEPRAAIMADPGSLLKRRRENDEVQAEASKRRQPQSAIQWAT